VLAFKRFSENVIEKLKAEIIEAEGNEVFALGFLSGGSEKIITDLVIKARGNSGAVLALDSFFQEGDVLIHNHPSGFLTPSDNDLIIASRAAQAGLGFYIVDNGVQNVYAVAEPVKKRAIKPLDPQNISAELQPGGKISERLPDYEIRETQLDLMRLIIQGFNEDALVAAEAGTGVGKSFAYLLPALTFAAANDQRIVISTATITLQEQLYNKDIPLVLSGLGKKVKAVLVKGRTNYVCQRRLTDALREPDLDEDERQQTEAIARWAQTSENGSRSDLPFMPLEGLWSRICSEADSCLSMRCQERERCFVMQLRRETADARILVVNHHLLFADLAARVSGAGYEASVVLPPYRRVIIDEAHTIEEAATSFFSHEFSRLGVYRQLSRLYRRRGTSKRGLLLRLFSLIPDRTPEELIDSIEGSFEKIRASVDSLDEAALLQCGGEGVFRLTPARKNAIQSHLLPEFAALRKCLTSLAGFVRELLEKVPEESSDDSAVWEVRSALRRLDTVGSVAASFLEYDEQPHNVMWIQRRAGKTSGDPPWAVFTVTPLDVAPSLEEALFLPNKTVVCVSATLTVAQSFNYWKTQTGLSLVEESGGREVLSGVFPSPFPYISQVLLAAPQDSPLPSDPDYASFVDGAAAALAEISGGSALILFTSYQALKSAHAAALPVLQELGIRVLKQGDDERSRLLASFLEDRSSVLFATDSFWEGVDAPGDTLRLVVLCRLPFKSPSDPVFEARSEAAERRGENAFLSLSLPEAVMKFKQGFGRLMRRSSDSGVVVVLDGRLLKKRYGQNFLHSLPETKTCFSDFEGVLRSVENFLF